MKLVQGGLDLEQLLISNYFSGSLFKFSYNFSCFQIIDESHVQLLLNFAFVFKLYLSYNMWAWQL